MIHIEPTPLNAGDEKLLRLWLTKPEAMTFVGYLRHKAASLTAEAGNCLTEFYTTGAEHQKLDADQKAALASRYIQLATIMMELSNQTTAFESVKLIPKPSLTTE